MTKLIGAPALCLALLAAGVVHAAPPPVEADPNRDYPVTPEVGPWVICAAYFTGPTATDLAHQMAYQIRARYNAPAYVFNYADEERKRQKEIIDRQRAALPFDAAPDGSDHVVPIPHHHMVVRVEEQCAVMIGGYPDENAAHAALLVVKKWPAPQLQVAEGVSAFGVLYDHGKEVQVNPFATQSMVVRNPTVPHESKAVSMKDDPFLKTLNADEEYSMLRCPGRWTLAVKEYVGASMVQQQQADSSGFLKMIGLGSSHAGESLTVAANNAHELAKTLDRVGFDFKPYVLHTRTSSVVSIGAFNGPDDPATEGVRNAFGRWQQQLAQRDPSKKDPLGLFPSPIAVEVPHP